MLIKEIECGDRSLFHISLVGHYVTQEALFLVELTSYVLNSLTNTSGKLLL